MRDGRSGTAHSLAQPQTSLPITTNYTAPTTASASARAELRARLSRAFLSTTTTSTILATGTTPQARAGSGITMTAFTCSGIARAALPAPKHLAATSIFTTTSLTGTGGRLLVAKKLG